MTSDEPQIDVRADRRAGRPDDPGAGRLLAARHEVTAPELAALLARLPEVTAPELAALRARLADRAAADGLLDVAYRTLDTPVGSLLLAATSRGLVRVAYDREDHAAVLATLAERLSPRVLSAPRRLDVAARELEEYFAGRRREFSLPLDFSLARGFRLEVLRHLPDIGYGQTASYGTVAAAAGRPRAVRAVGTACATNPLPVVVPCHRVVRADGSAAGYLGGPDAKRLLLSLEAA
jgi:methylated-DNA-[protein]-cysteine S-methyltransferase